MTTRALWEAIQAALDARRDPREEPAVERHLLAHPEDAGPLLTLLERVEALGRAPHAPARPARLRAAAGLLLALGLALAAGRHTRPAAAPPPLAALAVPAPSWRVTVERRRPGRTRRLVHEDGRLTLEERYAPGPSAAGPRPPTYTIVHRTRTRTP